MTMLCTPTPTTTRARVCVCVNSPEAELRGRLRDVRFYRRPGDQNTWAIEDTHEEGPDGAEEVVERICAAQLESAHRPIG